MYVRSGLPVDDTRLLVKRAKEKDLSAFEELVRIHQNRVYTLGLHLSGNREDAQDLAQEAFIRAYRALDSFRNEADFSTWLHRITVNVWLNLRRKKVKQQMSLDEPYRSEDGSEIQHEVASENDDPLWVLEQKELRDLVKVALMRLSDEHRMVLVLREIEGYSYDEISRVLGCTLGTVKSRLSRAREIMRRRMTELARENGEKLPVD
ncbi:MAG: sigma-70 family RNA polymerase sigma factor [Desulfotomaculaceae bacterium]|nr:sigma-70 family RNA polymerase sigma factor [Desulfotomaculaceae bacterium]